MTPEAIQYWVNLLLAIVTGVGVVGAALITMIFTLIKGVKQQQAETRAAGARTDQHVAENYGTLNQVKAQLDNHGAALVEIAKAVPPGSPTVVVTSPPPTTLNTP